MNRHVLVQLIFLPIIGFTQQWESNEPTPILLDDAVGFSIGNVGYFGTGRDDGFQLRSDIYQLENDSWLTIEPIRGMGRQYCSSFSFETMGCILTGVGENDSLLNEMQCFIPEQGSWTIKNNFPGEPRLQASSFSIDNFGFCGGGRTLSTTFKDWYKYNSENDAWSQVADFPLELYECVSFEANGFGFVGLGKDLSNNYNNRVFKYVPFSDLWEEIAPFPGSARIYSLALNLNNQGFICTGLDENNEFVNEFWQYDPDLNQWNQLSEPAYSFRRGTAGFTSQNCLHLIAGLDSNFNRLNEHWSYCKYSGYNSLDIMIYPNPTINEMMLVPSAAVNVSVYNIVGGLIDQFSIASEFIWDCSDLSQGVYLMLFESDENALLKKVIITDL